MVALAMLMMAQAACAQGNPWLGTWTLNEVKSSGTGTRLTVTKTATGFHFDTGATTYDLTVDGEDHDIAPDRSVSLQPAGPGGWLWIDRFGGNEVSRSTYTLSDGGTVLTIVTSGTRENGETFKTEETAQRKGKGNGLAGVWQLDENSAARPK
jgi:hypothetical protein